MFLAVTNQSLKATQAVIRRSRSKHREVWPGTGEPPGAQHSKLRACYSQSRVPCSCLPHAEPPTETLKFTLKLLKLLIFLDTYMCNQQALAPERSGRPSVCTRTNPSEFSGLEFPFYTFTSHSRQIVH